MIWLKKRSTRLRCGAFIDVFEQGFGLLAVVDLSAGQAQGDGATVRVDERMDLAGEAASRTSHAAIVSIPFLPVAPCRCTRTQVESIITISPSQAAETAAGSRSHTPALRQRTKRLQQVVGGP